MTRLVSVAAAAALALALAPPAARADTTQTTTGALPNGATLLWDKLQIQDENGDFKDPVDQTARYHYFNLAHCRCSRLGAGKQQSFRYLLTLDNLIGTARPGELWVGTGCTDMVTRDTNCRNVGRNIADINTIHTTQTYAEFSMYEVVNGVDTTSDCAPDLEGNASAWLLVNTTGAGTGTYDYFNTKNVDAVDGEAVPAVDMKPPTLPTEIRAESSEGAISLSWTAPTANAADTFAYQALCAKLDGSPVRTSPPAARYDTVARLCSQPGDSDLIPTAEIVDSVDAGVDAQVFRDAHVDAAPIDMPTDAPSDADIVPMDAHVDAPPPPDAFDTGLPGTLATLDPKYICAETTTSTATSLTIDNLENGTPYRVVLVSVDIHGNYVGTYFTYEITPAPVTDFWEDLHDHGSKVEGGFCLLSATYGDDSFLTNALRGFRDENLASTSFGRWLTDVYYGTLGKLGAYVQGHWALRIVAGIVLLPLVAIALLWHWLTLPGLLALVAFAWLARRRRLKLKARGVVVVGRRRAVLVASALGLLALALPGRAHADGSPDDWMSDNSSTSREGDALDESTAAKWHAAIRVGEFIPQIDAQLGGTGKGPYARMFGGYSVLPMLDVDRFFWTDVGQLGVGLSVGYLGKSAHPYVYPMDENNPDARATGAETKLKIIPLHATVTYRFSYLDEAYGIPVVPYLRGGLAYYMWFMTRPDGSFSSVCKAGSDPCSQNKGRGGSAGVLGTIGLAIRAERIDATAARSMHESGIEHAGFFVEYQYAKVDGFGSDTKLAVGDHGWFAGVDFEF